jgi:hypothetical protein
MENMDCFPGDLEAKKQKGEEIRFEINFKGSQFCRCTDDLCPQRDGIGGHK